MDCTGNILNIINFQSVFFVYLCSGSENWMHNIFSRFLEKNISEKNEKW